jgi:hypothetical protein
MALAGGHVDPGARFCLVFVVAERHHRFAVGVAGIEAVCSDNSSP